MSRGAMLLAGVSLGQMLIVAAASAQQAPDRAPPAPSSATTAQNPDAAVPTTTVQAQGDMAPAQGDILVTGIRSSIARSLNEKRSAGVVLESVNAEDIGKLPDQNVAEAIGRIPGVNVALKDGEGSSFTVRGLSDQLNRIEINGRSFVGPTQNGTPALETVNPEIFAGIDVAKSTSASQVEGALGATINLKTRRPLDQSRDLYSGRVQAVYGDIIDKAGVRASGLVSKQNDAGTFGVLLGAAYARIYSEDQGVTTNGWVQTNAIDGNGDGKADAGLYRPNRISSQIERRKDDRITLNGSIQWKPSDHDEVVLDTTWSRFQRQRDLNYYQLLLTNNAVAGSAVAAPDGTITSATITGATLRPLAYAAPSLLETFNIGATAKHESGRFKLVADASYSSGHGTENQAGLSTGAPFTYVIVPKAGNTTNVSYNFGASRLFPNYSLQTNFDQNNPANYQLFSVFDGEADSSNHGYDGRLDATYDLGAGIFKNIQAGARYERIKLESADPQSTPGAAALLAVADKNHDGIITLDELPAVSYRNQDSGNFLPEVDGSFPRDFLTGRVLSVDQARADVGLGAPAYQPASVRSVVQRSLAGYVQFNFEGTLGVPFHANAGMRYVNTRRTAAGNAVATSATGTTITPTSLTRDFNDWLPSGNIAFDLTDKLLLRFAISKAVARPALRDVAPGITVSLTNFTAASGNAALDPIRADQFDASLEWYFAPASILNVGLFKKNLSTFVVTTTTLTTIPGYPPVAANPSGQFQLSQPINAAGGKIQGVEVGYQQAFRFLPKPFDGFGVSTNFTYADSNTTINGTVLPLPNLSKITYNLVGYYENHIGQVRLAWSHRSKFLVAADAVAIGGPRYQDAYGQLDLSAVLNLTKRFKLTFDATNLTKQFVRQYNGVEARTYSSAVYDTRYYAGIIASF